MPPWSGPPHVRLALIGREVCSAQLGRWGARGVVRSAKGKGAVAYELRPVLHAVRVKQAPLVPQRSVALLWPRSVSRSARALTGRSAWFGHRGKECANADVGPFALATRE